MFSQVVNSCGKYCMLMSWNHCWSINFPPIILGSLPICSKIFENFSCIYNTGVPQGWVLRPPFFLIYINCLPEGLQSDVELFANDILLFFHCINGKGVGLPHTLSMLLSCQSLLTIYNSYLWWCYLQSTSNLNESYSNSIVSV